MPAANRRVLVAVVAAIGIVGGLLFTTLGQAAPRTPQYLVLAQAPDGATVLVPSDRGIDGGVLIVVPTTSTQCAGTPAPESGVVVYVECLKNPIADIVCMPAECNPPAQNLIRDPPPHPGRTVDLMIERIQLEGKPAVRLTVGRK